MPRVGTRNEQRLVRRKAFFRQVTDHELIYYITRPPLDSIRATRTDRNLRSANHDWDRVRAHTSG